MVRVLLGILAFTMCGFVSAISASQISRFNHQKSPSLASPKPSPPAEDPSVRSERSTNLSHITGTARKIQMYIKNRHLQLLPDGTVNGTSDDHSVYTILQRTTVGIGQLKIQGVATCQYLCMDSCGLLYGSKEFVDECIFNEMIEHHHYNTYSSTKYSNDRRTLYLAINRRGQPRKVMLRANQQLGRLSSYTRVLTRTVPLERAEEVHPTRHHAHVCSSIASSPISRFPSTPESNADVPRCRKRKKKKKKKRKCTDENSDNEMCSKKALENSRIQTKIHSSSSSGSNTSSNNNNNHSNSSHSASANLNNSKKCESEDNEECQREDVDKKRHKTKNGDNVKLSGAKKRKKHQKIARNKKVKITTTMKNLVTEVMSDEDYTMETTTNYDWGEWEESTVARDDFTTPPD